MLDAGWQEKWAAEKQRADELEAKLKACQAQLVVRDEVFQAGGRTRIIEANNGPRRGELGTAQSLQDRNNEVIRRELLRQLPSLVRHVRRYKEGVLWLESRLVVVEQRSHQQW